MKKTLIATLIAAPVLALSSSAFAAEPVELTSAQMDGVTAGFFNFNALGLIQINASPVTVAQLNILSLGGSNAVVVTSGNFSRVSQH